MRAKLRVPVFSNNCLWEKVRPSAFIIGDQQTMSIGQELRRLLRINEAIPAAEMVDRLEFIARLKLTFWR
jgi:hypothetical protein